MCWWQGQVAHAAHVLDKCGLDPDVDVVRLTSEANGKDNTRSGVYLRLLSWALFISLHPRFFESYELLVTSFFGFVFFYLPLLGFWSRFEFIS